jgi:tetratricopeptide (TPR) repeat protein
MELMSNIKKKLFIFISGLVFSVFLNSGMQAQILKDTSTFNLMCKGVDYIYNLQFTKAREIYQTIKTRYPENPMTYVFKGMITYWENYPLIPSSTSRESYENDMQYAIELCEKKSHPEDEAEYILSNIGARGMLLLFYADNKLSIDVFSLAASTYQLIRQTFDFTDIYPDFYFFTGLYNYYREAYPEAHPVYKPLAFLFPKGDRSKGLKELQIAAKNAIVLKAEAYSFLAGIYISFENDYQQAYTYSKSLHELYPRNMQYLAVYIKNLLLVKRYGEAESLIRSSRLKVTNSYYQAQLSIFNGILYEKKYHDFKQAQSFYSKGIRDIAPFGSFGNEFAAYAYFGLSRISEANGDKHYKKLYRKQAMDIADFKNVNFDR